MTVYSTGSSGSAAELNEELTELRQFYGRRDTRMSRMVIARTPGGLAVLYPDLFPAEGPYTEPMVANMIDVAARDISEVLSPPPTLSCSSSLDASDRARAFAEKRTRIAYGYFDASNMGVALMSMADQYASYGFAVGVVRADPDRRTPVIQFVDPRGCYPVFDQWDRTKALYEVRKVDRVLAQQLFPDLGERLYRDDQGYGPRLVEIVRYYGPDGTVLFCPTHADIILAEAPNPLSESLVHVFRRPGLTDEPVGQFDDVLAVQVAKARFALLTLEAAQKSVQAPLAMPFDVQEVNIGADATIRSATPQAIQRVPLPVPREAFAQQANLDQELRQGSRYPDARTGNVDQSIVTGRGVQALMTGFDSQIKAGQAVFAHGLGILFSKAFALDEALWPNTEKVLRGNANGTPYEIRYTPAKDIKGDRTVDVTYGLMAGLNPNQALVFGLQARGDKLISRDFLRKQMPFSMDAQQEESKVDVEELREALKAAVQMTTQAIPALAQQGMDPSQLLQQISAVINARQRGVPVEKAVTDAFAPKPPPAAETAGGPMGDPMAQAEAAQAQQAAGALQGAPPPAAQGGGQPAMMNLLAQLGTNGGAGLGAQVLRKQPI